MLPNWHGHVKFGATLLNALNQDAPAKARASPLAMLRTSQRRDYRAGQRDLVVALIGQTVARGALVRLAVVDRSRSDHERFGGSGMTR